MLSVTKKKNCTRKRYLPTPRQSKTNVHQLDIICDSLIALSDFREFPRQPRTLGLWIKQSSTIDLAPWLRHSLHWRNADVSFGNKNLSTVEVKRRTITDWHLLNRNPITSKNNTCKITSMRIPYQSHLNPNIPPGMGSPCGEAGHREACQLLLGGPPGW